MKAGRPRRKTAPTRFESDGDFSMDDGADYVFQEEEAEPEPEPEPELEPESEPEYVAPAVIVATPKPRTSRAGSATPTPIRQSKNKDSSFRDKISLNISSNEARLIEAITARDIWGGNLFHVDEKKARNSSPIALLAVPDLPDMSTSKLSKSQLNSQFEPFSALELGLNNNEFFSLASGDSKSLDIANRRAIALNTGGLITGTSWLTTSYESNVQYLAVSIINVADPISPDLTYTRNIASKSGLQIWEYNLEKNSVRLYKYYITDFGGMWNLKWLDVASNEPILGVLAAVTNDGYLRVFNINKNSVDIEPEYLHINETSLKYSIPDASISCFDVIYENNSIGFITGTSIGCLSHFSFYDPNDTDPVYSNNYPSYVVPIIIGYISAICVNKNKYSSPIVRINGADSESYVIDLSSLKSCRVILAKTKGISYQIEYNPMIGAFIHNEAGSSVRMAPERSSSDLPQSLVEHPKAYVSSLSSSILHPFILSGASDGSISINNSVRKAMSGRKPAAVSNYPKKSYSIY